MLLSLSSAIGMTACKGEKDTMNFSHLGKAAVMSTVVTPQKSNHKTQVSSMAAFLVLLRNYLLLAMPLQYPAGLLMARMVLWWGLHVE